MESERQRNDGLREIEEGWSERDRKNNVRQ